MNGHLLTSKSWASSVVIVYMCLDIVAVICCCSCTRSLCCMLSSSSLTLLSFSTLGCQELQRWFMDAGTHHRIRQWWLGGKVKTQLKSMLVLEPVDYQCFLKPPKGPRADWKKAGEEGLWGPHLIALPTPGCCEVEAILTMKAKQNNSLFSLLAGNSPWRISRCLQYT